MASNRNSTCSAIPQVNEAGSTGCQISGAVTIPQPGNEGFDLGMSFFPWCDRAVELGRDPNDKPRNPLISIEPTRIVCTEHGLRKDGDAPRQVWRPVDD